jgi:5'-nucleotidase
MTDEEGEREMRCVKLILVWVVLVCLVQPVWAPAGADAGEQFFILVTNDDGYRAPGLKALAEALAPLGEVLVAAPLENQSGVGHATTTREFVAVRPVEIAPGIKGFAIAARPATCTRLALEALVPRKPDLVVSGINPGMNLGIVVYYSGTLGAAREAALVGIPAVAVSMQGNAAEDYAATAAFVRRLVEQLRAQGRLRPGLFLNVNAPAGERKGVQVVRLSTTPTPQTFDRTVNPRGDVFYWSDFRPLADDAEGTDVWATARGFVAVTPLALDTTASGELEGLRRLVGNER